MDEALPILRSFCQNVKVVNSDVQAFRKLDVQVMVDVVANQKQTGNVDNLMSRNPSTQVVHRRPPSVRGLTSSLQVEAQLRVTFRKHEVSEKSPIAAEQDKQCR